MKVLFTILVTFFAGMGAGLGTGFAGMSAAAVISPMLITFLGMEPYMAVGIALSSDVLASAVSAYTYGKNKNLDVKNGLIMMVSVLAFTVVGSYVSSLVPSATMGNFSVFMTFLLGIKFIVRPVMTTKETMQGVSAQKRAIQSVISGICIGFICGFVGAGGGMMMLLILTSVLGYELKTAVGTSVFIMAFTAFTGAASHFVIGGKPDGLVFTLCVIFTLIWARIAAVFANKATPKTLNRVTGVVLVILGIVALHQHTKLFFMNCHRSCHHKDFGMFHAKCRRFQCRFNPDNRNIRIHLAQFPDSSTGGCIAGNHKTFCPLVKQLSCTSDRQVPHFFFFFCSVWCIFRITEINKIFLRHNPDQFPQDTDSSHSGVKYRNWVFSL